MAYSQVKQFTHIGRRFPITESAFIILSYYLSSFTTDMGIDFNILEYGDQLNFLILTKLKKRKKTKRAALEKLYKAHENKAAMGQLKTNLNQNNEEQVNITNSVVSNVA